MKKIKNIEFLRIILMLSILVFHLFHKRYLGNYFPDWCINTQIGDKAVEMFFIISGFLLVYTYKQSTSVFEFLAKKFIRFTPTIIFTLVMYWLLSVFTKYNYFKYDNIFNLFLLNCTGVTLALGNFNAAWFISVLVYVSLFYFCLMKYLNRNHANLIIGLITYFSFVLLVNISHGSLEGHIKIYNNIINLGMLRGLSCMGLGYLICCTYNYLKPIIKNHKNSIKESIVYSIMEIYLFIFLVNNLIFHRFSFNNKMILVIAFSILFWLFLLNRGLLSKIAELDIFSKTGKYTFSTYITHLCVYQILSYSLWNTDINMKLIAILSMIIAICVGIVVYHFVEKPSYDYLINKLKLALQQREKECSASHRYNKI